MKDSVKIVRRLPRLISCRSNIEEIESDSPQVRPSREFPWIDGLFLDIHLLIICYICDKEEKRRKSVNYYLVYLSLEDLS